MYANSMSILRPWWSTFWKTATRLEVKQAPGGLSSTWSWLTPGSRCSLLRGRYWDKWTQWVNGQRAHCSFSPNQCLESGREPKTKAVAEPLPCMVPSCCQRVFQCPTMFVFWKTEYGEASSRNVHRRPAARNSLLWRCVQFSSPSVVFIMFLLVQYAKFGKFGKSIIYCPQIYF